ncbi:hypothetical protein PE066_08730 [Ramlibacter tataouinensis]|uniref:hypothetical protein n=1 Tax=Ramlibacter tataouinensis TaxID=94132 RepID=UPI0022F3D7B9|nr:hypothetical protein [Ramlibacter tataouinensis]WBY03599.1 hypothetical protein PE066_08730 [Ramlibacter tataouinensis]
MVTRIVSGPPGGRSSEFSFVFDCGSINREHFQHGLGSLRQPTIDVLFISHLDADHVNGIDQLLAQSHVGAVVLPCLDALTIAAIACAEMEAGLLTEGFRQFLTDPVAWLARRGVRRVLFVQRADGPDVPPAGPEDAPGEGRPLLPNDQEGRRIACRVHTNGAAPQLTRTAGELVEVQTLSVACELEVELGPDVKGVSESWRIIPFYHPFKPAKLIAFRRAVWSTFRIPIDRGLAPARFTRRLLAILQNEDSRETLKGCYRQLSSDNNKPSLSVYSGPRRSDFWRVREHTGTHWRRGRDPSMRPYLGAPSPGGRRVGWISTGDADLWTSTGRQAWLQRYRDLLPDLGVFVVPHHGSNASLHDEVIASVRGASGVACAALGRTHHPHKHLVARWNENNRELWQVSEDSGSEFVLEADRWR